MGFNQQNHSDNLTILLTILDEKGAELSDVLSYGLKNKDCRQNDLMLLVAFSQMLSEYTVPDEDEDQTDDTLGNCLTQEQVETLWNYIGSMTKTCFPTKSVDTDGEVVVVPTYTVYYGSSALTSLTNTQVAALQSSATVTAFAGTYSMPALNYKYFAYPASLGTASTFTDTLTSLNVPMDTMFTVSISSVTYNVHRTFFPIVGTVNILIS